MDYVNYRELIKMIRWPPITESQRQTAPARQVQLVCSVQTERLLAGTSQYWTVKNKTQNRTGSR